MTEDGTSRPHLRYAAAGTLLLIAVLAPAFLAPGGLGTPEPVRVTGGLRAAVFRALYVGPVPAAVGAALAVTTVLVLLALVALHAVGFLPARGGRAPAMAGAALTAAGAAVAYLLSEGVKLVVDEERPCRALARVAVAGGHCPAPGDWSFPSNHTTFAFSLAAGLAVSRPRWAPVALFLAAGEGWLRVAAGVHYPHDVLAGALLGGGTTAALVLALLPRTARLLSARTAGRPAGAGQAAGLPAGAPVSGRASGPVSGPDQAPPVRRPSSPMRRGRRPPPGGGGGRGGADGGRSA